MTCTKITVSKKNKENSDENKLLTPPPIFGWAWDRECLISKTLYGPRIYAQVKFDKRRRGKQIQGKFRNQFNEVILPSSIVSLARPCPNFSILNSFSTSWLVYA